MFFKADQAQGAIGAVIPGKAGGGEQPGQSPHLNQKQFGKPSGPAEGAGDAAGGEAAAGAGAEAGGASLAELAPLLLA